MTDNLRWLDDYRRKPGAERQTPDLDAPLSGWTQAGEPGSTAVSVFAMDSDRARQVDDAPCKALRAARAIFDDD